MQSLPKQLWQRWTLTVSSTALVTLSSAPSFVLRLEGVSPLSTVESLVAILDEHAAESDDLSMRIKDWALEILPAEGPLPERAQIQKHIEELACKVLVDPVRHQRYLSPILDQTGYTWEKEVYESFKACGAYSPVDGRPLTDTQPHRLAEKMIAWLSPLEKKEEMALLPHRGAGRLMEPAEVFCWSLIAANSAVAKENRELKRSCQEMIAHVEAVKSANEKRLEADRESARYEAAAQTARVRLQIETIAALSEGKCSVLSGALHGTQVACANLGESCAAAREEIHAQKTEIEHLFFLNASLEQRIREAEERSRDRGGCTIL